MKKMIIVAMTMAALIGMGYNNEMNAKIEAQEAKIQQLTTSNEAYYEGMNNLRNEAERLNRVNQHYAQVLSAK